MTSSNFKNASIANINQIDPIVLTQQMIRISQPSLCLNFVTQVLQELGFQNKLYTFQGTDNVFSWTHAAEHEPALAFIGHVDVVPATNEGWITPPFSGEIIDQHLYGRGAVDMKGGLSCFISAIKQLPYLKNQISLSSPLSQTHFSSTLNTFPLCFLLTTDEEGAGTYGIRALLAELIQNKQLPNIAFALIGEPTTRTIVGDHIKIGGRGSLNVTCAVTGKSGHVAYSQEAKNPIPLLLHFLTNLIHFDFDQQIAQQGSSNRANVSQQKILQERLSFFSSSFSSKIFEPTHVEITSIDVGNPTANMIPNEAQASFNIRFNPLHTSHNLFVQLKQAPFVVQNEHYRFNKDIGGEPFLSQPSPHIETLFKVCKKQINQDPLVSAFGANSDARFIGDLFPFAELGLPVQKAHQQNEEVAKRDLELLTLLYLNFLHTFFYD